MCDIEGMCESLQLVYFLELSLSVMQNIKNLTLTRAGAFMSQRWN